MEINTFSTLTPGTIIKMTIGDSNIFYEVDHYENEDLYLRFKVLNDNNSWVVEYSYLRTGEPLKISRRSLEILYNIMTNIEYIEPGSVITGYMQALRSDLQEYIKQLKDEHNKLTLQYLFAQDFLKIWCE